MTSLSRALDRWEPPRVAAVALAVALVLFLVAYGVEVATSAPTLGSALAAAALVGIAGIGLLYAWRLAAGGVVD